MRASTPVHARIAYPALAALSTSQELFYLPFADLHQSTVGSTKHAWFDRFFVVQHEFETNAVIAPADDSPVEREGLIRVGVSTVRQSDPNKGSRVPSLFGQNIQTGQTHIANLVCDWGTTREEIGSYP